MSLEYIFNTRFLSRIFASTLLIALSLISAKNLEAQNNNKAQITGQITDTAGQPLPMVNVTLISINRGTVTDEQGHYAISGLPKGTFTIVFTSVGYKRTQQKVSVNKGGKLTVNATLHQTSMQLEELTVTGTPHATEMLHRSQDVQVLSGKEKQQMETTSLGGSLEAMPGVSNIATGSQFGKPVIRGLSGNRIRVLTDGFPMDYQQFGVRHMPAVDPLLADRIELVQGPASILYGSDAMGGAINIIPPNIPEALEDKPFVTGEMHGGYHTNNQEWNTGLKLEGAAGGFGFTGGIVRRSGDHIRTPEVPTAQETGDPTDPKFTGALPFTDFDQLNAMAGVGYHGNFGNISVNWMRWQDDHNFLLPNGKGVGQRITNDIAQIKGVFPVTDKLLVKPGFSYLSNWRQSNEDGIPRAELPTDGQAFLDILLQTYTGRLELQHSDWGPLNGRFGVTFMQQDQNTRGTGEALVPDAQVMNVAAFLFEEATFGKWTLNAGLRFDHRTQDAQPNAELNLPDTASGETADVLGQVYNVMSGTFGVNYRIAPEWAIAANVGRGFRAPSIFDLHAEGVHGGVAAYQVGDPYLQPETSLNTDISVKWKSDKVRAQVTAYRNHIDHYMFMINTGEKAPDNPDIPVMRTVQGNANLWGGYVDVKAQISNWLQVKGGFEMVRGHNADEDLAEVDVLPLLPADHFDASMTLSKKELGPLKDGYFRVSVRHASAKEAAGRYEPFWQFGNLPAFQFGVASTEAYTLLDAGVGFTLPFLQRHIQVDVIGKNILNTAYRDFLDTYKGYAMSPGRNVTLKIMIPFDSRTWDN